MNAITVITQTPIDEWVGRGRSLAAQRRNVDWAIADWMSEGKDAGFLSQAGFDLLSENLGIAPAKLKVIHKAASIPPHMRDTSLTVEHHAVVAALPKEEQLTMLHQAARDHWKVPALREAVTQWRYQHGEEFDDEDIDTHLCTLIVRAWNRGTKEARALFMEQAALANLGVIDEDEANG